MNYLESVEFMKIDHRVNELVAPYLAVVGTCCDSVEEGVSAYIYSDTNMKEWVLIRVYGENFVHVDSGPDYTYELVDAHKKASGYLGKVIEGEIK